jgi:hypothetical protein
MKLSDLFLCIIFNIIANSDYVKFPDITTTFRTVAMFITYDALFKMSLLWDACRRRKSADHYECAGHDSVPPLRRLKGASRLIVLVLLRLMVTAARCTDRSTDTVANSSSPWLQLIALLGIGLVKPSTFTETHEPEPEQSGHTLRRYTCRHSASAYIWLLWINMQCVLTHKILKILRQECRPRGGIKIPLGLDRRNLPVSSMTLCFHLTHVPNQKQEHGPGEMRSFSKFSRCLSHMCSYFRLLEYTSGF